METIWARYSSLSGKTWRGWQKITGVDGSMSETSLRTTTLGALSDTVTAALPGNHLVSNSCSICVADRPAVASSISRSIFMQIILVQLPGARKAVLKACK